MALGQKLIDETCQERTFHTRQHTRFTSNPILISASLFSFSHSLPAHASAYIHTYTHWCCTNVLTRPRLLASALHVWKRRLKCLALGRTDSAYVSVSFISRQERLFHFFFIPLTAPITRYHMLCTYLALHKCLLNGWLFPSPPPFPSHPYSITLKICCRAMGRGLRSVLTNNPYGCLKPKDRIFKAEIWAVTSWVFCEEMHKAVQIDSLSDRT